jgi:hypothetical protein
MGKKPETRLCNECDKVKSVNEFYKEYKKCRPCCTARDKKTRDARKQNKMQSTSEAIRPKDVSFDEMQSTSEAIQPEDVSFDEMQHAYKKQGKRVKKLEKTVANLSDIVDVQRRKIREIEEMIKGFVLGMKLEQDLDYADVTELST